jgi:hypothetical protein
MEFTKTEMGRPKLIKDGYLYTFKKYISNDVQTYECEMRRKNGQCRATIKLDANNEFMEQTNEHTHAPSQTKVEVAKVTASIKRKAQTTTDMPQQILGAELANISEHAAANLPSVATMRRNIRKAREDVDLPANPLTREAIPPLPERFQNTLGEDRFLMYDSGFGDHDRIFIFASEMGRRLLAESEHWYADGTFKVCPEVFFQLYTLHAQCRGSIFPCVFALLPNKAEVTYRRFYEQIFAQIGHNNLQDVLLDFEKAAINAIRHVNGGITIKGCFFHLSSNVWKHIRENGHQPRYMEDPEFALNLRMICALAFLPPDVVVEGFESLCDLLREAYDDQIDDLLEYFEDTYIGRYRRNAPRRPAMFPIELWNMFHRTHDELPRTNNSIEGWHRGFQAQVSSCHPVFWKFLQILQNEESLKRVEIIQNLAGYHPEPQRRRYRDCNARILTIVDDYANRDRMNYLRSIAHNIDF